jgi:hypothetical protein
VLSAHDGRGGTARAVVLQQGARARVLARGLLPYASLGQRRAVVTSGLEGDVRVSAVDYASGRTRPLLRMADPPWGLALDPGERLLALSATDRGSLVSAPRPRVLVKDLRTGRLLSRAVDDLRPGHVLWLSSGRFAVMGWVPAEASFYRARDLSLAGRLHGVGTPAATRLGDAIVGVDSLGYLMRSAPAAPALARIALLPTSEVATLVAVPGEPALRGASRAVPRAAAAASCPL